MEKDEKLKKQRIALWNLPEKCVILVPRYVSENIFYGGWYSEISNAF